MSAAVVTSFAPVFNESTAAVDRYQRAYRAAETVAMFGERVRLGGIVLGGVVFMSGLVESLLNRAEHFGFPVVFASMAAGAVLLVLVSQIVGMGFHAQGQLLKAAVDTDVNTSPFLSNAQRAKAMALRKQPAVPQDIRMKAA